MTPTELKAARESFGLSRTDMGLMLRYEGANTRIPISELERGIKTITPTKAALMQAYLSGYRPDDWPD